MSHLLKNIRILHLKGKTDLTVATSFIYGRAVSMDGFEGCLFITYGSSKMDSAGSTGAIQRVAAAVTTSGPWRDLANTSSTATWSSNSFAGKVLITDVYKPLSTQKFLRPLVGGASTDSVYGMFAIQYGLRKPGSSDVWKSSTRAGSSKWLSSRLGSQVLAISATHTTRTNT